MSGQLGKKVIVIGAGLGGMAAAIRLSRMGFSVTLLEKSDCAGGKMNEVKLGNYRFDTGPSLLTLAPVIDDLFQFAGYKREDRLKLEQLDMICRYFFPDGTIFDAYQDEQKMMQSLEKLAGGSAIEYRMYLKYTEDLFRIAGDIFLSTPIHEPSIVFTRKNLPLFLKVYKLDSNFSMHKRIKSFFSNEKLVQIFDRYATYNGSDPYQAPATLNMIAYVENVMGAYYIKGGMYRLVEQLLMLCQNCGVDVHFDAAVQKIQHQNGKISGVIVNDKLISADYVVCNNDVVTTFDKLIDNFQDKTKKLKKLEPSLSGLVFLWGIKKEFQQLKHHNIFFSQNYKQEFEYLFRKLEPPPDPTIYIAITKRADAKHAPEGKENWFVLLNMPYLTETQDWPVYAEEMRETVKNKLKNFEIDLENIIEEEKVITPLDFYERFGSNRGSIYGLSSNNRFAAFLRPANRNRQIQGLYFVGGSTHPGGGIPLVLRSGEIAANLIASREAVKNY